MSASPYLTSHPHHLALSSKELKNPNTLELISLAFLTTEIPTFFP